MQKKNSDRLERVREVVDEIIRRQPDIEQARCGFVHFSTSCIIRHSSSIIAKTPGSCGF